jgi:hypothetical protein
MLQGILEDAIMVVRPVDTSLLIQGQKQAAFILA